MKNIHDDLSSLDLGIFDARSGAKLASLETDVFAQRYAVIVVHATIGLEFICHLEPKEPIVGWRCTFAPP